MMMDPGTGEAVWITVVSTAGAKHATKVYRARAPNPFPFSVPLQCHLLTKLNILPHAKEEDIKGSIFTLTE